MVSQESHTYWLEMRKYPQFGAPGNEFSLEALRQCMGVRQEPANPDIQCIRTQIDRIDCEWVMAPGADPDLRLLYLHGGGYISGSGANYLPIAADISAAAQCAVLLPDYRLAPEHRFPAGLEDCLRAYEWMLEAGPYGPAPAKATFIAGDSAGGGLTLATLLALRDHHRPLPNGAIPMSAFTDLTLSSASIRSQADYELFMHPSCLPQFVECYVAPGEERNPLASPVFGNYPGIPPLLIQVGDFEVIRDDSIRVANKARARVVKVTLEVWPGQVHVSDSRTPGKPRGYRSHGRLHARLACTATEPNSRSSILPAEYTGNGERFLHTLQKVRKRWDCRSTTGETILFIGDSITDCGRRGGAALLGDGYVRFFSYLLAIREPEKSVTIINKGISGDRVTGLQSRWTDDVLYHQPDWLSIKIGINDLHSVLGGDPNGVTPDIFTQAYEEILARTRANSAVPHLAHRSLLHQQRHLAEFLALPRAGTAAHLHRNCAPDAAKIRHLPGGDAFAVSAPVALLRR